MLGDDTKIQKDTVKEEQPEPSKEEEEEESDSDDDGPISSLKKQASSTGGGSSKSRAVPAAKAPSTDSSRRSRSSSSKGELSIAELKERYKDLRGQLPRGNSASNPTWLQAQIEEAESAGAGGGDTEVAELKRRYKALKGKNPKGKSSNDVDWIRARIADMESEQQQEGPRAARWAAAAAAAVTATGQPRYQQSIYRGVTWDGQHWRAAAPIDYTGGNYSHQGSLQAAYHNQKTSKLGPAAAAVATPSPFLGYFDDEVDAAIR